ncbi:MAG: GNAT family protein [Sphaerochaeta sp.]|jgi:ribosomal-protein-alanine N-acetyltransferase|uniref:GNAT family N-acetyltransferase n=1 Tax=Sphaerochaeta sp. TaxID=1972642 RepID=UPI002FCA5B84
MHLLFETLHLKAYLLDRSLAKQLLAYEKHNKEAFLRFSNEHPQSYYTPASFEQLCDRNASLYAQKRMLPVVFFPKQGENHIRAVVNINQIVWGNIRCGRLTYSVDHDFQRQGYGKEAVGSVIGYAFKTLGLHRMEAHVMPANEASTALVVSLGFTLEGLCHSYLYLHGKWEDHQRFALVNPD